MSDKENISRLPPNSVQAEQSVLGCILMAPQDCMGEFIEACRFGPEVFYDLRHQNLFKVLLEMYDAQSPIDLVTVHQRLVDAGKLQDCGGVAYVSSLPSAVPSAAGLEYYIDIVVEKYLLRRTIQLCTAIVGRAYEHFGNVEEFLDTVERDVFSICEGRGESVLVPARTLVLDAIAKIEDLQKNAGKLTGISTGLADFDKQTTGLHGGEMVVIAARTSVGKTSLAMNIAEHVACDLNLPVGVFSLEMTKDQLMLRMLCSRARVSVRNITDGFLVERDFPKLTGAAGKIAGSEIWIDDTGGLSILKLKARARRMKQKYGIKLFVIDYLQLLHSPGKAGNRQEEVSQISCGIKELAKELDLPIIVLSQLNRGVENRKGDRPRLADIRESGSIEQDGDLIGLLYREKTGGEEEEESDAIPVGLDIAKQRNGPTGVVHLTFLKSLTRFESAAKVGLEDLPPAHAPIYPKRERRQHDDD